MRVRGENMPPNVAPAVDLVFGQRNKLQVAILGVVQHELPGLLQRRRFEQCEIFPLARDDVERAMKALDVLGRDRNDGNVHGQNPAAARTDEIAAAPGADSRFRSLGSDAARPYLAARSLGGSASWGSS